MDQQVANPGLLADLALFGSGLVASGHSITRESLESSPPFDSPPVVSAGALTIREQILLVSS
jgi:hypothetical protein